MNVIPQQVQAGQAVYTKRVLRGYDFFVLGINNHFFWRCPTRRLVEHYNRNISANHLDVGVGTGYFLDHCRFPVANPRICLMDLNPNTLEHAARRIARYHPKSFVRNVLEPLSLEEAAFDSIGINHLLHCLPGTMESNAVALDYLKALMNPGAVLFGSTLVQGDVPRNWAARRVMDAFNKKGIFSNEHDSLAGLRTALEARFAMVEVKRVGCTAVFSARG